MNTWTGPPASTLTGNSSRSCFRTHHSGSLTWCCSGPWTGFSREGVRETLNHLERLASYGVEYRSFTEQYLDSCGIFKDAVLGISATIAKQERVRLSERTLAGLERPEGRPGGWPSACHRGPGQGGTAGQGREESERDCGSRGHVQKHRPPAADAGGTVAMTRRRKHGPIPLPLSPRNCWTCGR